MKALILISVISTAFCCRSKNKITVDYKENIKETERIKVDSVGSQSSEFIQNEAANVNSEEDKNETSGNVSIKGKSDLFNPFVFHHVVGKDTVQSISIVGTAEYLINNHYTKYKSKKSEFSKNESVKIVRDSAHQAVLKETANEINTEIDYKTKEIKTKGFQAGAWIVISIAIIVLILTYFTYKYLKK